MVYLVLADLVVAVHATFVIFVVVGGLLVQWWPRLLWLHVPAVVYGLLIFGIGFTCPLTTWEKDLRRAGGEQVYPGGFIDRYIEGELYPRDLDGLMPVVAGVLIIGGYLTLIARYRSTRARPPTGPARQAEVGRTAAGLTAPRLRSAVPSVRPRRRALARPAGRRYPSQAHPMGPPQPSSPGVSRTRRSIIRP